MIQVNLLFQKSLPGSLAKRFLLDEPPGLNQTRSKSCGKIRMPAGSI